VNHGGANTTAICEGYHASIKSMIRAKLTGERNRVDSLIHTLFTVVAPEFVYRTVRNVSGAHQTQRCRPYVTILEGDMLGILSLASTVCSMLGLWSETQSVLGAVLKKIVT
jgi:hypothetical protein